MVSTGHNSDMGPSSVVRLVVRNSEGRAFIHELQPGNGAVTGSDRTCSLHLEGDEIGALHCMIRYEFGEIHVKDWYSDSGTFINNHRIDTETVLPDGGEIRIGSFQIRVANAAEIDEFDSQPEGSDDATLATPPVEEITEDGVIYRFRGELVKVPLNR